MVKGRLDPADSKLSLQLKIEVKIRLNFNAWRDLDWDSFRTMAVGLEQRSAKSRTQMKNIR